MNSENRLYVGNLDVTVDEAYLRALAKPYGELKDCVVMEKMNDRQQKCKFGFVAFATPEQAEAMLRLNDTFCQIHQRRFVVREASQRKALA